MVTTPGKTEAAAAAFVTPTHSKPKTAIKRKMQASEDTTAQEPERKKRPATNATVVAAGSDSSAAEVTVDVSALAGDDKASFSSQNDNAETGSLYEDTLEEEVNSAPASYCIAYHTRSHDGHGHPVDSMGSPELHTRSHDGNGHSVASMGSPELHTRSHDAKKQDTAAATGSSDFHTPSHDAREQNVGSPELHTRSHDATKQDKAAPMGSSELHHTPAQAETQDERPYLNTRAVYQHTRLQTKLQKEQEERNKKRKKETEQRERQAFELIVFFWMLVMALSMGVLIGYNYRVLDLDHRWESSNNRETRRNWFQRRDDELSSVSSFSPASSLTVVRSKKNDDPSIHDKRHNWLQKVGDELSSLSSLLPSIDIRRHKNDEPSAHDRKSGFVVDDSNVFIFLAKDQEND